MRKDIGSNEHTHKTKNSLSVRISGPDKLVSASYASPVMFIYCIDSQKKKKKKKVRTRIRDHKTTGKWTSTRQILQQDLCNQQSKISLRIRAVLSEPSLIACAFYRLQAIQRGMNEKPCHTAWMYRLIWVFVGHKGLIEDFVVRRLKYNLHYSEVRRDEHTIQTPAVETFSDVVWCVGNKTGDHKKKLPTA